MIERTSLLAERSPHLTRSVERHLAPEHHLLVQNAFEFAYSNGGFAELGFKRKEGVSYNPRPARVALIIIEDAAVRSGTVAAAGIIACAETVENFPGPAVVAEIAEHARRSIDEILNLRDELRPGAIVTGAALALDRARHFHQREPKEDGKQILEEIEKWSEASKSYAAPLAAYLSAWCDRYRRISG